MRTKSVLVFLSLIGLVGWGFAQEIKPVAVSPGSEIGVARVSERCPTFSWSALGWAVGYRVAVFETKTAEVKTYESLVLTAVPVLKHEIKGKALSWTPSAGERLKDGGLYVWYVQARDAAGNGLWSVGKTFLVEADKTQLVGVEDRVTKKLRERGVAGDVIADVAKEVRNGAKAGTISKDFSLKSSGQTQVGIQVGNAGQASTGIRNQGSEGTNNTYYGDNAGDSISSGSSNALFGVNAGTDITTATNNTLLGHNAGMNTTGSWNTFVGSGAGWVNGAGTYNTFVGYDAGSGNMSGSGNTNLGMDSGQDNQTGTENTMVGFAAGRNNTTSSNTYVGYYAGEANTIASQNTFVGARAGEDSTVGNDNTFIGNQAGRSNSGYYCTFIGYRAGYSNSEDNNTFIGMRAGFANTDGTGNVFLGQETGDAVTTGSYNTFLGKGAGGTNITGSGNVFLGYGAGIGEAGSNKLYIDNSSDTFPLIYGNFSSGLVAVNGKLGVGVQTPAYPIHLQKSGTSALMVFDCVGGAMSFMTASASGGAFGTQNNYPVQILANGAYRMQINANNSLNMASGATCTAGGTWTNASSRRLKENIRDLRAEDAQATLAQLAPVRFNYKADREDECLGFIAEDVPTLVATKDRKGLSPMDVVAVLTKVVQEQQKMIDELRMEIDALKQKIK